ncbi:MAG: hypothetical protein NVS4B12_15220 [Ktedonobacteraceae bacterium]
MNKLPFLLCIVLLIGMLAACGEKTPSIMSLAQKAPPPPTCVLTLRIAVTHGPDVGLQEQGSLISPDDLASFVGKLQHTTRSSVKIGGQVTGHAITITFDLGEDQVLVGSGLVPQDFRDCHGAVDGPLVGPRKGDDGKWTMVAQQAPVLV